MPPTTQRPRPAKGNARLIPLNIQRRKRRKRCRHDKINRVSNRQRRCPFNKQRSIAVGKINAPRSKRGTNTALIRVRISNPPKARPTCAIVPQITPIRIGVNPIQIHLPASLPAKPIPINPRPRNRHCNRQYSRIARPVRGHITSLESVRRQRDSPCTCNGHRARVRRKRPIEKSPHRMVRIHRHRKRRRSRPRVNRKTRRIPLNPRQHVAAPRRPVRAPQSILPRPRKTSKIRVCPATRPLGIPIIDSPLAFHHPDYHGNTYNTASQRVKIHRVNGLQLLWCQTAKMTIPD